MEVANFLQVVPRKTLLKDSFDEEGLENLLSKINEGGMGYQRKEFERNMRAFMDKEEHLISEGHGGKYALFYEGKCWGILESQMDLLKSFHESLKYTTCYCDQIYVGK